ncbi:PAAR domain-containing protein [Stenotrophomonas rhizophila]|uniref:PAAR domain-containing protein n=1 Tax=Stenotrophomonas rhizophila TaxID=216778 RepID=UPI0028B2663B|nr:PAAR domain-containing protein [Stenotrophomonas rhizophila]
MARNWIVMGDPTSSGGQVITASNETDIMGMGVARIGDKATCPKLHKGIFPIVDGDITILVDGQPVALHGCALACGCRVLSGKQANVFADSGAAAGSAAATSAGTGAAAGAGSAAAGAAGVLKAVLASAATFDQAIRFVGKGGTPLAEVPYTLHLADGRTVSGTTDAQGETTRVSTEQSQTIVRAELRAPAQPVGCCARVAPDDADDAEVFDVDGVVTTSEALGTSIAPVTAPGHERGLTPGEIDMARLVFGDAVDYAQVKVHNHGYWMFFGFQNKDTAVTPNGEMYFPKGIYKDDYSTDSVGFQQFFIHEMTHVWQYQLGYNVKLVRAPRPNMSYDYVLDEIRLFPDYNMEAQGDMLADYFLVAFRGSQSRMNNVRYRTVPDIGAQLERTLQPFLAARSDKNNLPRTTQ